MLGAALTAALLEVSAASVTYDVAARVDSRVRSNEDPAEDAPSIAGDTDITPTLGLALRDGNTALMLDYAPRISLREITAQPRTEIQHIGRLAADWRPERGLSLRLSQDLVLGAVNLFTTDVLPLPDGDGSDPDGPLRPPEGGGPLQPLPEADTVYFLSSATTLTANTSWLGRGWQLGGSTGFSISGGLDGPAREAVPMQYGPRFDVSLSHALSSLSAITTSVSVNHSRFSTGANNTVVTLTEGWGRRVSRRTSLQAGAGVSVVNSLEAPTDEEDPPEDPVGGPATEVPRLELLPNLTFSVGHHIPSRTADFNGSLGTRITPFVDRLTGRVYPRADLTLTGSWMLGPRVRVSSTAGTAFAVGGATGDRIINGGVSASWFLTRWVSVDADTRSTWSRSPELPAARLNWAASLGLSVRQTGIL
ncbi:exopolysaccharide export protein EpsX [Pyxidicoccus caerfyrddinensis]|uniref:exopolysaccharide export protein EpsX n=1 Tax=Pyxidicoccus caerfyrddinensis TaxID=2709663 RepID=UPI0013DC0B41|nr:exopolysaccharide export protein EpsX [Pyxidicoccus caerfyrddinensis]